MDSLVILAGMLACEDFARLVVRVLTVALAESVRSTGLDLEENRSGLLLSGFCCVGHPPEV
jgi:hypothetical protein